MRKTEWLIFGATFSGCSFALLKDNCIIFEEGCTIGKEFAASFNQKKAKAFNPKTKESKAFYDELKEKNFVSDSGEIYCLPTVFELAKLLKEKNTEVHFDTVVSSITKKDDGFLVEFSNCDGLQTIFASHILDTTSLGAMYQLKRPSFLSTASKSGEITNEITNVSYFFEPFDRDFVKTKENSLKTAKDKNYKILMSANCLCYRDEILPFEKDGINFAPSDGFYNPLYAFEGGVLLAKEL